MEDCKVDHYDDLSTKYSEEKTEIENGEHTVKDTTKNKTNYIQNLISTIAAAIFNCFVDIMFNILPASAFFKSGITVCSASTLLACGMGASIYLVRLVVLTYLQNEKRSTLRREMTDFLVSAVAGGALNMIATLIFAEAQVIIIPTLVAGAIIGASIYVINKVVSLVISQFSQKDKVEEDKEIIFDDEFSSHEDLGTKEDEHEEEVEQSIPRYCTYRIDIKDFENWNFEQLIQVNLKEVARRDIFKFELIVMDSKNVEMKKIIEINVQGLTWKESAIYYYGIDVTNNKIFHEVSFSILNIWQNSQQELDENLEIHLLEEVLKIFPQALENWKLIDDINEEENVDSYSVNLHRDEFIGPILWVKKAKPSQEDFPIFKENDENDENCMLIELCSIKKSQENGTLYIERLNEENRSRTFASKLREDLKNQINRVEKIEKNIFFRVAKYAAINLLENKEFFERLKEIIKQLREAVNLRIDSLEAWQKLSELLNKNESN